MYSFIEIVKGEYKTWTVYFVMKYSIWLLMQKGKKWSYTNKYGKRVHVAQSIDELNLD